MRQGPAIMICVGATKAGTSWVHDQVSRHPDCEFRSIKELHYFDALRDGRVGARIDEFKAEKARLKRRLVRAAVPQQMQLQRRIADLRDWIAVLSRRSDDWGAYGRFLTAGREAQRMVGEVTPAYATLPAETLRQIAGMAEDVRIVYLMRDPVARLWSHVRMLARREATGRTGYARAVSARFDRVVASDPFMQQRGEVVAPDRLLTMFSEELMTEAGMAQLWGFLDLPPVASDFTRRVHEGLPMAMTADQRLRARAVLLPQYEYVARAFRALPDVWRQSMEEVGA